MNSKKMMLIPGLIIIYFFIHFSTDLFYFIEFKQTFQQLLIYLIVTGCIYFAGFRLFKNKDTYTLLFSTILFLFLFYGSLIDMAANSGIMTTSSPTSLLSLVIVSVLVMLLGFIVLKLNNSLVKSFLKFWLIYLIVLIFYDITAGLLVTKSERKYLEQKIIPTIPTSVDKPSVFFLVFDMYPSYRILKDYLHYDNDSIHRFLIAKNFFITRNARSLYKETYYSIGSTLSLIPLTYMNDHSLKDYKKKLVALKNINNSLLVGMFSKAGYVINNYSVFNLVNMQSPLQFNLNYHLENALTASTFFNRMNAGIEPDFIAASRNVDLSIFKKSWSGKLKEDLAFLNQKFSDLTNDMRTNKNPSFNYFHFMMPHPPTIYDSNSNENKVRDYYNHSGYERSIKNFTSYTIYANKLLEKMVDQILQVTEGKVVIIIQGDHGYREFASSFPDAVRHGVFNAVYLPKKNYRNLNDSQPTLQTLKQVLINQFY